MNMCSEDNITGGKIRSCDKVSYPQHDVFVCPIIYYDDNEKVVK